MLASQLDSNLQLQKLKKVSAAVKSKPKMVETEIVLSAVLKLLNLVKQLGHFWFISTVSVVAEL